MPFARKNLQSSRSVATKLVLAKKRTLVRGAIEATNTRVTPLPSPEARGVRLRPSLREGEAVATNVLFFIKTDLAAIYCISAARDSMNPELSEFCRIFRRILTWVATVGVVQHVTCFLFGNVSN